MGYEHLKCVQGHYLNAALLKTGRSGKREKGDRKEIEREGEKKKEREKREANKRIGSCRIGERRETEDLGLSCLKVPDESSVSSSR